MWVGDYVALLLCGYMGMWRRGYVVVWLCGYCELCANLQVGGRLLMSQKEFMKIWFASPRRIQSERKIFLTDSAMAQPPFHFSKTFETAILMFSWVYISEARPHNGWNFVQLRADSPSLHIGISINEIMLKTVRFSIVELYSCSGLLFLLREIETCRSQSVKNEYLQHVDWIALTTPMNLFYLKKFHDDFPKMPSSLVAHLLAAPHWANRNLQNSITIENCVIFASCFAMSISPSKRLKLNSFQFVNIFSKGLSSQRNVPKVFIE